MIRIKKILVLVFVVSMLFLISACGETTTNETTNEATKQSGQEIELNFVAAPPGGEAYAIAVAMTEIWKEHIPGFSATVKPGGNSSNVKAISTGIADLGVSDTAMGVIATQGGYPFDQPYADVNLLAALFPSYEHATVWANSSIQTFEDLRGKKVNVYPKGYSAEAYAHDLLETYGITYDDIKANYLDDDDANDYMQDGHLDATISNGSLPDGSVLELSSFRPVRVLSIDDEHMSKIIAKNPGLSKREIPANTYKGQEDAVQTVGSTWMIAINPDLPEDVVYEMAKSLDKEYSRLGNVVSALGKMGPESLAAGTGLPYHPGAEKYYKEKGWLK